MKTASLMIAPFDRLLEHGSILDRKTTEACDDDEVVSGLAPRVYDYWGIYGARNRSNKATGAHKLGWRPLGAHPLSLWLPRGSFDLLSKLLVSHILQKKFPQSFSVFGLCLVCFPREIENVQKTLTDTGRKINKLVHRNDIK